MSTSRILADANKRESVARLTTTIIIVSYLAIWLITLISGGIESIQLFIPHLTIATLDIILWFTYIWFRVSILKTI